MKKYYTKFEYEGNRVYIPWLVPLTTRARLSRKIFAKAQGAQDYALKFMARFKRMKEAQNEATRNETP